jgi:hypothetical protein
MDYFDYMLNYSTFTNQDSQDSQSSQTITNDTPDTLSEYQYDGILNSFL